MVGAFEREKSQGVRASGVADKKAVTRHRVITVVVVTVTVLKASLTLAFHRNQNRLMRHASDHVIGRQITFVIFSMQT